MEQIKYQQCLQMSVDVLSFFTKRPIFTDIGGSKHDDDSSIKAFSISKNKDFFNIANGLVSRQGTNSNENNNFWVKWHQQVVGLNIGAGWGFFSQKIWWIELGPSSCCRISTLNKLELYYELFKSNGLVADVHLIWIK